MIRHILVSCALLLAPVTLAAETPPVSAIAPAPLANLVARMDIPYEQFTLPNGLRVVVHTDRKSPLVSVGVWYHVGSKDEPLGKAGYAHLFEHLMFYGSEHSPVEHFAPLEALGASDFNGTTSFDRTNYFQTVPTPALDLALFLESDRMGWLLPALSQAKLDAQRKVVLNEKRQGDNRPYGLVSYALLSGLFPPDHPYSQSTIGRVADLEKATLDDARDWFHTRYGPNNAVLVLAGDIDAATARPLAERWFGQIPPGPGVARFAAPVPKREKTTRATLHDRIATTRLIRAWAVPGRNDADAVPLSVAMAVFADGPASRLYQTLVRDERLAVDVSGSAGAYEDAGIATISIDLAPNVTPAQVEARLNRLLADYFRDGPTADEVERVAMRAVSSTLRGLEKVGGFAGKGTALAEGALYADNPAAWKRELAAYAAATPANVRAVAARWLANGDHQLTILPGERKPATIDPPQSARSVAIPQTPPPPWKPVGQAADRSQPPAAGTATELTIPAIERAKLSNGMEVVLARRPSVPVVRVSLAMPLGLGADRADLPGTQNMMLAMLEEGTDGRLGPLDGPEIARRLERLGAATSASATLDRTRLALNALTSNLDASLALFADIVRAPSFPADQLERVRAQALTGLKAELSDPVSIAWRALPPLLYGEAHPYGRSFTGTGTQEALEKISRDDLMGFHRHFGPAGATLFVVGDTSMSEIRPKLEKAFGDWRGGDASKTAAASAVPPSANSILLIDRPAAPQTVILAGAVSSLSGRDDILALNLANDVLGGRTTSRLFRLLREEKGWSYGVRSSFTPTWHNMPFLIQTSVDSNHAGDSVAAIRATLDAQRGSQPPTAAETATARNGSIRSLPGDYETMGALLGALERGELLERPDDYLPTLPARLAATSDEAVAKAPLPAADALRFIVVGDKATVLLQLQKLGLPVEVRAAE
ncbi:MAG: pitrilysin family protein [Sphingomonadaceae bacterium]